MDKATEFSIYTKGDYQVLRASACAKNASMADSFVDGYIVYNTKTDVVEHASTILYECMRLANIFDDGINNILNPKKWDEKPSPLEQMMFDFNGSKN